METQEEKKSRIMSIFSERYDEWDKSQEGQTDAYEYEASFDKFINKMSKELLQQSVGEESDSRKKKL
jgi:hypothetical protein